MILIIASLSIAAASPSEPPKQVFKVKVNGALFKVRRRGDTVTVKRQSLAYSANIEHRDMMREAAEQATECQLKDEMINIAAELEARLDCPK